MYTSSCARTLFAIGLTPASSRAASLSSACNSARTWSASSLSSLPASAPSTSIRSRRLRSRRDPRRSAASRSGLSPQRACAYDWFNAPSSFLSNICLPPHLPSCPSRTMTAVPAFQPLCPLMPFNPASTPTATCLTYPLPLSGLPLDQRRAGSLLVQIAERREHFRPQPQGRSGLVGAHCHEGKCQDRRKQPVEPVRLRKKAQQGTKTLNIQRFLLCFDFAAMRRLARAMCSMSSLSGTSRKMGARRRTSSGRASGRAIRIRSSRFPRFNPGECGKFIVGAIVGLCASK
jgi:hypothetical protein